MGKHEQLPETVPKHGFWATLRLLIQQPLSFLLGLLAMLTVLAVIAVNVGNRYGQFWGALVGGCIAPLIGGSLLRGRLNRRR
jgi:hypothetical protein